MTLTLKSDHGQFLAAEDGGGEPGQIIDGRPAGLLTATREEAGPWEGFDLRLNEDGTYSLWSVHQKALCCENAEEDAKAGRDGILVFNRDAVGPWERFKLWIAEDDGRVSFESVERPGYFLKVFHDGTVKLARPEWEGEPAEEPGGYEKLTPDPPITMAGAGRPLDPAWGPVRLQSELFKDARGPLVPVGLHFGEGFSAFCRGKGDVEAQLHTGAGAGYDHHRTWGNLGYYAQSWRGREVAFCSFSNNEGELVPATPDYYGRVHAYLQMCERVGIRVLWSQGDMNSMHPDSIREHLMRLRTEFDKLPHTVFGVELANEKWQNFPSSKAHDEEWAVNAMREAFDGSPYVLQNSACDPWLFPDSGESPEGFAKMVHKWFPCANVHGTRSFDDMEFLMRRHFNYGYERYPGDYAGSYAMQSTEPGGPGQGVTVGNTSELWKIVGLHLSTLIGRTATVYMSGFGVYWDGPIESQPGFKEVGSLKTIFPPNAFEFAALHGNRSDAWFTSTYGFADAGEGYGRVDQLVSDSNRFGLCLAHSGKGRRMITSRRSARLTVYGLDLSSRGTRDVTHGDSFDLGGDVFFTAQLM